MTTTIKTGFLAALVFTIACKKESNVQYSRLTERTSNSNLVTEATGKYTWVKIGSQKWMNTNLAVSHYRNGEKIAQVKDSATWANLTTGAWCWYNNDPANDSGYGKLYNWYAVHDPRGLAPTGWHIPTGPEWDSLNAFLSTNVGGKLKDTGTIEGGTGLWYAPNRGATNKTGFTALPGGFRYFFGEFRYVGRIGIWWNSSDPIAYDSYFLSYKSVNLLGYISRKSDGYSVRCIKDDVVATLPSGHSSLR